MSSDGEERIVEAAAFFLLQPPTNDAATLDAQNNLFGIARGLDPSPAGSFRAARGAVREALRRGAAVHCRRRWALGVRCPPRRRG